MVLVPVEIIQRRECHFKKKPDKARGCERCGKTKKHEDHMGTPPSFNTGGSVANKWTYQNVKHAWQDRFTALLEQCDPPLPKGLGGVLAEGQMCFPDRGRRDQGNFRVMVEKALGDALSEGGWIEDDDWSRYEFGGLEHKYVRGESWTRIVIFPRWGEGTDAGQLELGA